MQGPVTWWEAVRLLRGLPLKRKFLYFVELRRPAEMGRRAIPPLAKRRFQVVREGEERCGTGKCARLRFQAFTVLIDVADGAPYGVSFEDGTELRFAWER